MSHRLASFKYYLLILKNQVEMYDFQKRKGVWKVSFGQDLFHIYTSITKGNHWAKLTWLYITCFGSHYKINKNLSVCKTQMTWQKWIWFSGIDMHSVSKGQRFNSSPSQLLNLKKNNNNNNNSIDMKYILVTTRFLIQILPSFNFDKT